MSFAPNRMTPPMTPMSSARSRSTRSSITSSLDQARFLARLEDNERTRDNTRAQRAATHSFSATGKFRSLPPTHKPLKPLAMVDLTTIEPRASKLLPLVKPLSRANMPALRLP